MNDHCDADVAAIKAAIRAKEGELAFKVRIWIASAIEMGAMLRECKRSVSPDQWPAWLQCNFAGSRRLAEMYIAVACVPPHNHAPTNLLMELYDDFSRESAK